MKDKTTEELKKQFEQLKEELKSREEIEHFNMWNKMPKDVLSTKEIRSKGDGTTLFSCHVDDGMESHPYFIEAEVNQYTHEEIIKIVQAKYITDCGGEDEFVIGGCPMIYHIHVEEIGRYGYTLLKVKK